ncbi:uncharacterized protein [Rutidosis leptorrhynchoides]|uniref:uncharacterized protein n=1 Tax=Rutidosis leptorrhynchoides TaxID=125765 RepID=UPI003A99A7EE
MLLALSTKNKVGFVDGTCEKQIDNGVLAAQWDRYNSVVLSWILNFIYEDLNSGQIFSATASVVWTELKETYDKIDGSQYDEMVKLPACTCVAAPEFQSHNKTLKLMQFLMGLDDSYMSIKSNLLLRDPLPDVKSAFAILSREESHRGVSGVGTSKTQNSAYVAQTNNNNWINKSSNTCSFERGRGFNRGPNPNLKCTKCNKIGHTIDICFEIVGYPNNFKKSFNGNTNRSFIANNYVSSCPSSSDSIVGSSYPTPSSSTSSPSPLSFSNEQMMKLLSILNEKSFPVSDSVTNMSGWIIDSGASQHMTVSEKSLFNIVDVSDLNLHVTHPNGTKAKVNKVGDLKLNKSIILTDVLIVPGYCDLKTRNTLGTGSVNGGLYLFDVFEGDSLMCNSVVAYNFESVLLWHNRLGHPASPVLNI